MRKKFTIKQSRATAIKCTDKKYVKFLTKKGFEGNIPFVSEHYLEIMSVPLAEFGEVNPHDWFLEISHGVDWASKNIQPLTVGDVVTLAKQVYMYVPVNTPGSTPLNVSSKLSIKLIGNYYDQ